MPITQSSFKPSSGMTEILNSKFLTKEHSKHQQCVLASFRKIKRDHHTISSFADIMAGSGVSFDLALQVWPNIHQVWLNDWEDEACIKLKDKYQETVKITKIDFTKEFKTNQQYDFIHIDFNTFSLLKSNIYVWDNLRRLFKLSHWLAFTDTACHCWHINYKFYGFVKIEDYYNEIAYLITGNRDSLYSVIGHKNAAYIVLQNKL